MHGLKARVRAAADDARLVINTIARLHPLGNVLSPRTAGAISSLKTPLRACPPLAPRPRSTACWQTTTP
eukprot:2059367-Lingulodinium_polyedra.AAC.1